MLDLLKLMVIGAFLLVATFLVLLALPKSKLRDVLKPWVFAFLCFLYIICPIDILPEAALGPFGLVDDLGAVVAGVNAIRSALKARQEQRAAEGDIVVK